MSRGRDDFSAKIKETLYKRAGYVCSNPDCRVNTLAPSEQDPTKSVFIGKAAHIAAASRGGPRYDSEQLPEERSSIANGIFLCSSCADLIDKNGGIDYPADLLVEWKLTHERWVRDNLNRSGVGERTAIVDSNPRRNAIVARAYSPALNLFLVKFRMNLHCLITPPIEPAIDAAFHAGRDLLQTKPDLSKITDELLRYLFKKYDFCKPMINFTPHDGQPHPTNIEFLFVELLSLKGTTEDLLSKYAGSTDTDIVQNMELLVNRIDNLVGPFGISSHAGVSSSNIDMLIGFFNLLKEGLNITKRLLNDNNV